MATFTTIKNRGGGRGALAGVLQYIRQDEKTLWEGHRLVSGWNCTAPTAWQEIDFVIQYVYIVTRDDLDMFCLFQRLYFLIGLEICFYIGMQPADDVPELSVALPGLRQVDALACQQIRAVLRGDQSTRDTVRMTG